MAYLDFWRVNLQGPLRPRDIYTRLISRPPKKPTPHTPLHQSRLDLKCFYVARIVRRFFLKPQALHRGHLMDRMKFMVVESLNLKMVHGALVPASFDSHTNDLGQIRLGIDMDEYGYDSVEQSIGFNVFRNCSRTPQYLGSKICPILLPLKGCLSPFFFTLKMGSISSSHA